MVIISKLTFNQAKNLLIYACKTKNSSIIARNRVNYSNIKLLNTLSSNKLRNDQNLLNNKSLSPKVNNRLVYFII
jgi:hypothetical protein